MPFFNGGSSGSGGSGSGNLPVLTGSGAPGSTLGSTGQIYIDSTNNVFYGPKGSSGWPTGISFGAGSYSELSGVPSEFTPEDHTHVIADVTDLQTELDAKATSAHTHVIADVTNLQTDLDAKATTTELTTAVTDLIDGAPDDLNTLDKLAASIADNASYAEAVNLALAGKSDTTHQHNLADLSNVSGTPLTGQLLRYNGTNWTPVTQEETANTLTGLSDVSTVTPTSGYYLRWDGTQWYASTVTVDFSTGSGNLVLSPFTSIVEIRGDGTNEGSIQFNCSQNSHGVKIQSPPHSASASYTLTLPDDVGSSGQVLQTDGTGGLSWLTVGGSGNSVTFSSVPSSEAATGSVGEMALDTLYLYVCVSTDNWKRIPLQSFSGATGGGGGNTSGIFITQQPAGGTTQGGEITLSVSATVPSGSINYQWQKLGSGGGSGSTSINLKTHPGAVFEGEDSNDLFGWKLEQSGDGNTVVASGYLNDDSASNAGMVRVLRWNGTSWAQIGGDINPPNVGMSTPYFGADVSVSHDGDTIAIAGGRWVIVYDWNSSNSNWTLASKFGAPLDYFGNSQSNTATKIYDISLNEDGTRLALCRPEYKIDGTQNQMGAVFIHDRASRASGFTSTVDSAFPLAADIVSGRTHYYTSVSLSKDGDRIACGGYEWDSSAGVSQVGGFDVFEWDSTTSSWSQLGSSIYGDSQLDFLTNRHFSIHGSTNAALAMSDDGTHVIAGARDSAGQTIGTYSGYAAVWSYDGSSWSIKGSGFRGDQTADQRLGTDVDISSDGSRIVITSDGLDTRSTTNPYIESYYPQIQVYDWNSTTASWDQVGRVYAPNADSTGLIPAPAYTLAGNGCAFGAVASLSSDGTKLIASAPGNALSAAGRLLEYEFVSSGSGSSGSSSTWLNVTGAVYSSLDLAGQTASNDGDQYRCFLTASGFSDVISNTATIAVTESGVDGVTSTAPSLLFDRNVTQNNYPWTVWKATGKNWTYPGWSLIKEEAQWEYSSDNLHTIQTKMAASSNGPAAGYGSGRSGTWNYYLVAVPPTDSDYLNISEWSTSLSGSLYDDGQSHLNYLTALYNPFSLTNDPVQVNEPMTADFYTKWYDTISDTGKWNRSARFRTRAVLTRTINGVEEQATTNFSEWSNWRSDPAGNIIDENINSIFTIHPQDITIIPNNNDPTSMSGTLDPLPKLEAEAELAGNNKRYAWYIANDGIGFDIIKSLTHDRGDYAYLAPYTSQFDGSMSMNLRMIKFSGAKSHTLRCLGAADWKKAVPSDAGNLTVSTTDNTNVKLTAMGGNFTGIVQLGLLRFDPIFSVQDLATGGTLHNDVTRDGNGINSDGDAFFTGGNLHVFWETSSSYGASTSQDDWARINYTNSSVTNSNYPMPQISDAGNVSVRVCWRFVDMDLRLVSNTYQNVTTVWSDWIYIS